METSVRITLLLASIIISVYAKNPVKDHIFVFDGEHLTIDCVGGEQLPILKYRKTASLDPTIYFMGQDIRTNEAISIQPRKGEGEFDIYYDIESAVPDNGGEYECDWTAENDETNHYVNVVDNATLACPQFTAPVNAGEAAEGLECSISKHGTVIHSWLNNEAQAAALGLKFTVEDSNGNPVKVMHEETTDKLTAKVVDLTLTKEQNGATLTCKFVSMHGTEKSCQSNAAQVLWKPSGLKLTAPEVAEIGKSLEAKCDLADAGNPASDVVLKVNNDTVVGNATITPTKEQVPTVTVSCNAGDVVDSKVVPLHSGPESIVPSVEKIVAKAGDKMDFACTLPVEPYPSATIVYKIGETVVEANVTAKTEYNGEEITCTAVNPVSKNSVTAKIPLDINFAPMATVAAVSFSEELGAAVELKCTMAGNPVPVYKWTFTPASGNTSPSDVETTSAVHAIDQMTAENVGSYVCTASNDHGEATKTFTLEQAANAALALLVPNFLLVLTWLLSTLNLQ